ncbi:MAG: hypothetical protein LQ339_003288 [Xanthoria mediterranea]|nr:MAG: hypothetical protein LQ339_003288 [Xanthoria mediterranea]
MSESSDNRGDPIDGPWFVDDDGTISDEETSSASERDVPKMDYCLWFTIPLQIPDNFDVAETYDDVFSMSPTERRVWAHDALTARAREHIIRSGMFL